MKKLLTAILAVAFLSTPAFAAEEKAPPKSDKATTNEALKVEREKKAVEETHAPLAAKKKAKKAPKAKKSAETGAATTTK